MHIEADRALIPANTHAVRHLTITITAPAGRPRERRAPVSVALVLDRSGSMDGPKIEMARHAVAHAIKLLSDQDQLALVVYDDEVDTLLERTRASKEAKNNVLHRLAEVRARGATDLSGGWFHGSEELGGTQNDIKRVLLLTDGLANRGVVDHDELARAAADLLGRGITTTAFGVGADFDEELLTRLATQGGGHFYFIARPKQIPDFFASELGEMLDIVARDAVLDITCGPGVARWCAW